MKRSGWSRQAALGALGAASLLLAGAACKQRDGTSMMSSALGGATYGEPGPDAGLGTGSDEPDAGVDAGFDAADGPGSDSGLDAGSGSGLDAGSGSGTDAGSGSGSDAGSGSGSDAGSGSGSDGGVCSDAGECDDICTLIAEGVIDRSEVGQMTLDMCDGVSPMSSECTFTPVPGFDIDGDGCNVQAPSFGDLGNYSGACPTDIYEQQDFCQFAMQANGPARIQDDAEAWVQSPDGDEPSDDELPGGFAYPDDFDDGIDPATGMPVYAGIVTVAAYGTPGDPPPNDYFTFAAQGPKPMSAVDFYRQNQFEQRPAPSQPRNVVVLGSSMMSTHNQTQNGLSCSRASTRADRRRLRGNDFQASPAWSTRVPWRLALALGRTGFTSGDVRGAAPGARDTCRNQWLGPASPMQTGVNWLGRVGTNNARMITDGGLINDQQSRTGGWSDTLAGLVACNAMQQLTPALNALLNAEHAALNPNPLGVRVRGAWVPRQAPTVRFVRQVPVGVWGGALDLPANQRAGRCWYATTRGNGRNPLATLTLLGKVEKEVPPLIRLWTGGPPGSPVPGNLTAIKNAYTAINVKQIWLQYPYMDTANVVLRGSDLKLLWPGVSRVLIARWGGAVAVAIPAIDPGSRPRIRQVTDDLNKLMYDTIGCNAVAAFAAGHPARVCARAGGAPRVVITRDAFAGWGVADHQDTIVGGMPHESAAGANKLGAAIVAADALP